MILSWSRGCESLQMHLHPHDPSALLPSSLTSAWWITSNQSPTREKHSCSLQQLGEKAHTSILDGRIPWTEGSGGLQPGGSQSDESEHKVHATPPLFSPIIYLFNLIFFILYWNIGALQCCVSFCCMAKWISYVYTNITFFGFPSHLGHHRASSRVPWVIE